ncbi:energy transducer TonB, partial [Bacteroides thetaiotaomicron]
MSKESKAGKVTCRILKEIRQQIANANDIKFVTSKCRYQGDCLGTCPKCEAEIQIQYLQPIITQYFIDNKSEIW